MSDVEFALLEAGLVAIALVAAVDFEARTGEIPNLVPLASLVAALAMAFASGRWLYVLGGALVLGAPAILAYTREALRPDAAKLAVGLGACLGIVGAAVTLALGAVWLRALARQRERWRRAHKPMPRIATAPRVSVFAAVGAATELALSLWG